MKKIILAILMAGFMSVNAQAEPTIDETVAFIQKVLKNDKYSSKADWYEKPLLKFDNTGCKIEGIKAYIDEYQNIFRKRVYLDLSKQRAEISDGQGLKKYGDYISFTDRQGVASISMEAGVKYRNKRYEPRIDKMLARINFNIILYGVYKEKMNKALNHLSDKCYQKYGVEDNEPF